MNEHKRQILQMLAEGKINTDEAERLLDALGKEDSHESSSSNQEPKDAKNVRTLHVIVHDHLGHSSGHEKVHIRVPMMMLKAGMKLSSLMPEKAMDKLNSRLFEKGLDIKLDKIDSILEALKEGQIDIESDDDKVHIFCD